MWELNHKASWVPKNWCFWTVVLEKTLESPLDCEEVRPVNPKGNQSWISLEGLILKLELQYFGQLMRRTDSLEETLMIGKFEGRRRGRQRMRWLDGITTWCTWVWASSGSWWLTGKHGMLVHGVTKNRTRVSSWTELNWKILKSYRVCYLICGIMVETNIKRYLKIMYIFSSTVCHLPREIFG